MEKQTEDDAAGYHHLLTRVAQAWSMDESRFLAEQRLEIDEGVIVSFQHLPHTNLCRVGLPLGPAVDDMEVFKCMLESNCFPDKGALPVMALDAEAEVLMLFAHYPAIEEAEMLLHGFLDIGAVVLREYWKTICEEGVDRVAPPFSALA